jgi:hypothetical protein
MLARHADDGSVVIEADPLGQYPVFVYWQAGLFGITNNVFWLVDALRALKRRVEKDGMLFGSFVATGTGFADATGFSGVKLLPLGARVSVSPSNRMP